MKNIINKEKWLPPKELRILNYIKTHKNVQYSTLLNVFGDGGHTLAIIRRLVAERKVKKKKCVCGKSVFYY